MSVAVQVVNGREQGAEEEEEAVAMAAEAPETVEVDVGAPAEEVLSDGEDHRGVSKKKKFSMKPWKSIRKIFKKKKNSKGSEGDGEPSHAPNKSKSKSTGELETGGIEDGELDKRMSMSEDSVFTPDNKNAPSKHDVRNSYTLNTSNLADEINAKLKERASSSDDGYAQSSEDAMTTGDTTHDNSEVAPLDSSKTDSGIVTTEDEKSFTSVGAKESRHAAANMKRPSRENPGDIDLDLIHSSKLLSSSAAKHRISVAPSNRRPSRKARAGTPQKRSSSRLDDGPTPIEEEPTTPTKSPTPLDLDSELPFPGVVSSAKSSAPVNGATTPHSKTRARAGLGPMVLPRIPPQVGPKGTKGKKTEPKAVKNTAILLVPFPEQETPFPEVESDSTLPSLSLDATTKETSGVPGSDVIEELEPQGKDKSASDLKVENEPAINIFEIEGDSFPCVESNSDKRQEIIHSTSLTESSAVDITSDLQKGSEMSKVQKGMAGVDIGVDLEGKDMKEGKTGGGGEGLAHDIADLDLLVDLPDPLDLGSSAFGVETILEGEEEDGEVGKLEESDDFEDSFFDDLEDERGKPRESVLAIVAEKDGKNQGNSRERVGKLEEKRDIELDAGREKDIERDCIPDKQKEGKIEGRDESTKISLSESTTAPAVVSQSDQGVLIASGDNDHDVDDSNYPGLTGNLKSLSTQKASTRLSSEDSLKKNGSQVVIIETPPPEDQGKPSTLHSPSHSSEAPLIPCPKEVIIIMKEQPEEKKEMEEEPQKEGGEKIEEPEKVVGEEEEEKEMEEKTEIPTTPTSPEPAPEVAALLLEEKEEVVEKETLETQKETEEKKQEEEAEVEERIIEEKRMSVKASKALFEARIPAADPVTKSSSHKAVVNGNGVHDVETRRGSDPEKLSDAETKGEADAKLSEKEKEMEKTEEKDIPVISEEPDEKEPPISLKDRISRYQNLATKTSVKGLTSHVPRMSPSKQRPASTSQIENKDSPRKFAPKVPSKPSSISSNRSREVTTDTSSPSTKSPPPSSRTPPPVSPSKPRVAAPSPFSSPQKPPQQVPPLDRCMVCEGAVYPNDMCRFQGHVFHRRCQRCRECGRTLTLWNTEVVGAGLYCKQHGSNLKNSQLKGTLLVQS